MLRKIEDANQKKMQKQNQLLPEPTVGALIFNKFGKIFLMKSDKWKGMYCLPGGHIELGETIIDAVRREIKEETNLVIENIRFHSIQDCIYTEYFYKQKHFIFIDFICNASTADVVLNDEGTEYIWADLNEIENLPIEPFTKKTITLYTVQRAAHNAINRYIE